VRMRFGIVVSPRHGFKSFSPPSIRKRGESPQVSSSGRRTAMNFS
jgi:hypothetical protein